MKLLDAHNHIQSGGSGFCGTSGVMCVCNGTCAADWEDTAEVYRTFPASVIPYFGVHPWFADNLPGGWETELRRMLEEFPFGIGEIGLDRSKRGADTDVQKRIFVKQLETASDMELPVSIHCVRAWGMMTDILKDICGASGIPFMMHSFSGSLETMERLAVLGGYFSFGPGLLDSSNTKLRDLFGRVPLNRILLETDFPPQSGIVSEKEYGDVLREMYSTGSALKGMELPEFIGVINDNGKIFTDGTSHRQ